MSQYKVPQNVDMQDKIVGPLTMFQFLYLLAGGMIFYTTFKAQQTVLMILVGIPAALVGLAMAFVKVNDRPFGQFVIAYIFYLTHPKSRVWHQGGSNPTVKVTQDKTQQKQTIVTKLLDPQTLKSIAQSLDTQPFDPNKL